MIVLFETAQVLVVDKPPGITVIPDRHGNPDLVSQLSAARGERLWVVHRLDREVSGVLALARSADAHRQLNAAFEGRTAEKTYRAVSGGEPPGPPGWTVTWDDLLLHGKKRSYVSPHGKQAVTDARFLGGEPGALRWELAPRTGRTHQLRVHLAGAGFPIAGDVLYGSAAAWAAGIALRAVRLRIPGFAGLDVSAPVPQSMA